MYADALSIDRTAFYQGDIISDFPFYIFENVLALRRTDAGHYEVGEHATTETEMVFGVGAKVQNVMILSQTCDAQRRSNVILCPVYQLNEFTIDNTINVDRLRAIRERRINYWFYLPAFDTLQESIADLQAMIYVPRETIERFLPSKTLALSDLGRHHLSWSLATFFGRPASETA